MSIVTSGGLQVVDANAQAGFHSCIRVSGGKNEQILFDCGVFSLESVNANWVFITHGHTDHVGACISHARARALTHSVAKYYVPADVAVHLEEIRSSFSKLDGNEIPMDIIIISPGESVRVGTDDRLRVQTFQTEHRVPAQGYAVYSTINVPPKLLTQYSGASTEHIKDMKRRGIKVQSSPEERENLDLVYTGDTIFNGLLKDENRFIFMADILIMELTYLEATEKYIINAAKYMHVHIGEVVEYASLFLNKQIIFTHISAKYTPWGRAVKLIKEHLPVELLNKSAVTLKTFGAPEPITPLCNSSEYEKRGQTEVGFTWGREQQKKGKSKGHKSSSSNISANIFHGFGDDNKSQDISIRDTNENTDSILCPFFNTPAGCENGAICDFSHQRI